MADLRKIIIDDIEVEVDPAMTLIQACEAGGDRDPALLLPRAAVDRRQLPDVPRGGRRRAAEARCLLRDAGARPAPRPGGRAAGRQDEVAHGQEGAGGGDGVPPHQPPARLPDLRPGRRMRPAGPGDGLWRGLLALPRAQARGRRPEPRAARRDAHDALHLLHPLRALHHRGGGDAGDGADGARGGCRDHVLPRARRSNRRCRGTSWTSARWGRSPTSPTPSPRGRGN
jgi:hypothetical protein